MVQGQIKQGGIGEKGWWAGEKKNGWFAARFVLDSRPPAVTRSREDERLARPMIIGSYRTGVTKDFLYINCISLISSIPPNRAYSMLELFTKFSVISSLVVIALQLPRLIKNFGTWGQVEVIHIESSNDSDEIASLKSQLKAAQEEAKVSTGVLQALARVPDDASQDESKLWMQRWSLVMKEMIHEIGVIVLEVEPQLFDPVLRRKGPLLAMESVACKLSFLGIIFDPETDNIIGDSAFRQDLLLAYGEFVMDLNALAIVFSTMAGTRYLDETPTLYLQVTIKVAISRVQKIITRIESITTQAKADVKMRAQGKEIGL